MLKAIAEYFGYVLINQKDLRKGVNVKPYVGRKHPLGSKKFTNLCKAQPKAKLSFVTARQAYTAKSKDNDYIVIKFSRAYQIKIFSDGTWDTYSYETSNSNACGLGDEKG